MATLMSIHGVISVKHFRPTYDSLQTSWCMSDILLLGGPNTVSALVIGCFDQFVFWLCHLFCLL